MPLRAGVHRSKLHLRVLLQGLLRKSILIKRSLRWGWSSRSSPELGLRRIRKLKGRKDAQDRKKSIAVKVVWQNIPQALSPVLGCSVVWFCCYLSLFLINWMPLTWCTQAFKSPLHQKRFAPMLQLLTKIHWWYIIVAQLNGCTSAFSAAHCFCRLLPFPLEHLCSWSTLHHLQNCTLAKSPRLDQVGPGSCQQGTAEVVTAPLACLSSTETLPTTALPTRAAARKSRIARCHNKLLACRLNNIQNGIFLTNYQW